MNWRRFFRRSQSDAEQREELESYVEITTEEYIAQGMSADQARRATRLKLGNPTRIREEVYEMNTATFIDSTVREARHAVRMLRLNPGFSLTAILTLALGIGATTAMFSVVNAVVIKPLPYPDSEAVVTVTHSAVMGGVRGNGFSFSPQMFETYSSHGRVFEELGIYRSGAATMTGMGDPERANTLLVTAGTLRALDVPPALGRWFSPGDDRPGAPGTAILSYGYWKRRFGSDPGVIGHVVTLDSTRYEVIGVMPARFDLTGRPVDLILPARVNLAEPPRDFSYSALARLKPGMTVAQANADIARMLPMFLEKYAGHVMDALHLQPAVRPLKEDVVGNVGQVLWVLLGSISILLLIACANVANLLLVRAETRGTELAVRSALGAEWGRLARGLMVESLTLGLIGGLLGVGLAYGGLRTLLALNPANLPRLNEITIDLPVLVFTLTISILSGLLFGLIPILKLARPGFVSNLAESVRGGGRWSSGGKNQHRSQNTLVVVQVALALVILISSGLMIRTFQRLRSVDPGFTDPATIQAVRVLMPNAMSTEPERVTQIQGQMLKRLAAIPGVTSAGYIDRLPMEGAGEVIVYVEDVTYESGQLPPTRMLKGISPGVLRTLGTPLRAGRDFEWAEINNERNVALISEGFARATWNSVERALGKRIRVGIDGPWQEVIGVVADVHDNGVDQDAPGTVYWPSRQHQFMGAKFLPLAPAFALRSDRTGTESFLQDIRKTLSEMAPDLPIAQVRTQAEVYNLKMARTSFALVLLAIAGGMALLLGIVGIYGVLAYAVTQRQREVGIRLALGAEPRTVKAMFVYRGMLLSVVGIVFGTAVALGITRWMSSLLFGVSPVDPITFVTAAGVLLIAALSASYVPARRAAGVAPMETLRGQ